MIGINQFRWALARSRVAQPHLGTASAFAPLSSSLVGVNESFRSNRTVA
jgi:hypothetical protein